MDGSFSNWRNQNESDSDDLIDSSIVGTGQDSFIAICSSGSEDEFEEIAPVRRKPNIAVLPDSSGDDDDYLTDETHGASLDENSESVNVSASSTDVNESALEEDDERLQNAIHLPPSSVDVNGSTFDENDEGFQNAIIASLESASKNENFASVDIPCCSNSEKSSVSLPSDHNDEDILSDEHYTLLQERQRLSIEMEQVKKSLSNKKVALGSVNVNTLPDKGMRLRNSISRETKSLQKLEEQMNRVVRKLELSPCRLEQSIESDCSLASESHSVTSDTSSSSLINLSGPRNLSSRDSNGAVRKTPNQSIEKITIIDSPPRFGVLPSVNVHDLGKQALETHQTQQALIVQSLQSLHSSLQVNPTAKGVVSDPRDLTVELMPHQREALAWLLSREKQRPSGGILADDMGLGKTLAMISLILKDKEAELESGEDNSDGENDENDDYAENRFRTGKRYPGGTLVVCPASILAQWESEIKNRVKYGLLNVVIHHGQKRDKKARRLARPDVLITSYSIVQRDVEVKGEPNAEGPLCQVTWKRVILDEAHIVRNHKSLTAMSVFKLRAKHRWCLTGTPIHNKQLDLFALIKFLRCSPFDDLVVWKKWIETKDESGEKRLNMLTKALMLRRTKQVLVDDGQLKSLPEKKIESISVSLKKEEFTLYEEVLNFSKTLLAQFLHQQAEKANLLDGGIYFNKKTNQFGGSENAENPFAKHPALAKLYNKVNGMPNVKTSEILVLLLRLRQICCHPALLKSMIDKESNVQDGIQDEDGSDVDLLERLADMSLNAETKDEENGNKTISPFDQNNPIFKQDFISSKIEAVLKVLEENILTTKDKVVIVSQWTSMLELIHDILKDRGIRSKRLTGKVPVDERMGIVEKFNSDSTSTRVLLLSLTAGGTGLNLVGGNNLLLVDIHWNPQLEAQACDRIYRVGQKKNVTIYKFLCSETIEERIQLLQQSKLELADSVLAGTKRSQATKLTLNDLKMLFNVT